MFQEGMSEDVSINKFFDEAMVVELAQQAADLHQQMLARDHLKVGRGRGNFHLVSGSRCFGFFLIGSAVADTCGVMDEWRQNPNASSALEEIIPRVDNTAAQDIFKLTKGFTFSLICR
ncbi:unnamed protein product [Fraxinus pennsylvanica]|uniref:Uncharacterized protein n=1 Tax=Fraxinus pennsylvanica TaxID=56036 RepID=A0AAD1ZD80_9LAMI|nr:unnamed protein product [Fraxinus pennsylvanica]